MKMSTPFPGRRRKVEGRHEKMESPVERAREYRDEPPKRKTLKLNKRGK
jgi:hypothetical protein